MALHIQSRNLKDLGRFLLNAGKLSYARICSHYHQQQILKREEDLDINPNLSPLEALHEKVRFLRLFIPRTHTHFLHFLSELL